MAARVPARLEKQSHDRDPRRFVEEIAGEFLPLAPARADEAVVRLEFSVAAITPHAGPDRRRTPRRLRDIDGRLLRRLGVDDPVATEHLAAVLDGLALSAALHPDRLDADTVRAVPRHHVAQLPRAR
ncbi:TetR family transcriptional regulator C-terminal domain-containing protein [Streptomyces sp. NPDC059224]|uniref:TetR family transcriptional regulator C-terminal domain-containing protein n=1 Tax=Streptomyces sp. NPDC059224 TaxID=3346775 RepID=UPI003678D5F9